MVERRDTKNVVDLQSRLCEIERICANHFRCYDSELHGISHLREVALLAGRIAVQSGADVEAAMVAGFLHDCGRMNDGGGRQHALGSVELARPILVACFPHLDASRICKAIAEHADGKVTDDPLIGAVWDADRLTLRRLGYEIREELLSTAAGKRMVRMEPDGSTERNTNGPR
jgi:uncharacterized protein